MEPYATEWSDKAPESLWNILMTQKCALATLLASTMILTDCAGIDATSAESAGDEPPPLAG